MVGAFGEEQFAILFYIGTILANSLCQMVMTLIIRHDPDVAKTPGGITDQWRFNSIGSTVALAVAFMLVALVPAVSYFPILLLAVPPLIARAWYGSAPAETA